MISLLLKFKLQKVIALINFWKHSKKFS